MRLPLPVPLLLIIATARAIAEVEQPGSFVTLNGIATVVEVLAFIWLAHQIRSLPASAQLQRIEKLEQAMNQERALKNALIQAVPSVEGGLRSVSERLASVEDGLVELRDQVHSLRCIVDRPDPPDDGEPARARAVTPAMDAIRAARGKK